MEIEMARDGAEQHAVDGLKPVDRTGSSETGEGAAGVNDGVGEFIQGEVPRSSLRARGRGNC